jgi:uncharacterized membrane protein YebE (DUF533 family)
MHSLNKSRFAMWRAVVAMMHADSIVKPHEINFVLNKMKELPLSDPQRETLMADIDNPTSVEDMYYRITLEEDKEDFFHLARALAWADGDFDVMEEKALNRLSGHHIYGEELSIAEKTRDDFFLYLKNQSGALDRHDPAVLAMIRQLAEKN